MKLLPFSVNFENRGSVEKISIFIKEGQDPITLRSAINQWLPIAEDYSAKSLLRYLDGIGIRAFLSANAEDVKVYNDTWKEYHDGVDIETIVDKVLFSKNFSEMKNKLIRDFCKDLVGSKQPYVTQLTLVKANFDIFLDYIDNLA